MFKNSVPLNPRDHAGLRYAPMNHYAFASREMLSPIVSAEAKQIAREYAFVFPKETGGVPLAILGTESGVNSYVDTSPPWWGRYIPSHIRRYPFILAPRPDTGEDRGEKDQQYVVMIDQDAPHLGYETGDYIFDPEGQPGPALQNVRKMLQVLQREFERTSFLVRQIEEAGLLVERHIHVKSTGKEAVALTGFRVVDTQKLSNLSPDVLRELLKTGAFMLIYAHLISLTNLEDGLLAKKARGEGFAETPDIEALFSGDDDIFKFDA